MYKIIASKTILDKVKKEFFEKQKMTVDDLRTRVFNSLQEEMEKKQAELDTPDKMIAYLLSVGDCGNSRINDMFVMYRDE